MKYLDTYKELLLQVRTPQGKRDKIISEIVLCFENQFGKKTKLSDNDAWILHRIFIKQLKEEVEDE